MKTTLYVSGTVNYPKRLLNQTQIDNFKSALTYTSPFIGDDGKSKTILLYSEDDHYLRLPVEWVKVNYPKLIDIATDARVATGTLAASRLPSPNHPSVKNPEAQAAFIEDMKNAVLEHHNVLAYAPTGSGKTVVSLRVAAELGYRTLVLVHSEELRDQWIREIQDKLGLSREDIGIIQQNKCEIEGKQIVIGLLQTQARRIYDDSVYDAFGLVIVDECHKISTEFFADILPRFNAKYRIGLSATPKRKDGQDIVLLSHLGSVRVIAKTEVMPIKVFVHRYYTQRKLWGNDFKQRIMCLSQDPDRNNLIVQYIKELYHYNRNILVVSHSVAHIEKLISLCIEAGIPSYEIGQFTATKLTYDRTHTWKVTGKKTTTPEERAEAKERKIIFATENLIKEAIDIPRLDAGIDAVPFFNATQRIGRIRRFRKGKLYPKWITIRDMKCNISQQAYNSRVNDYNECGAELIVR